MARNKEELEEAFRIAAARFFTTFGEELSIADWKVAVRVRYEEKKRRFLAGFADKLTERDCVNALRLENDERQLEHKEVQVALHGTGEAPVQDGSPCQTTCKSEEGPGEREVVPAGAGGSPRLGKGSVAKRNAGKGNSRKDGLQLAPIVIPD